MTPLCPRLDRVRDERFDVLDAIEHAPTDFEALRTLTNVPPVAARLRGRAEEFCHFVRRHESHTNDSTGNHRHSSLTTPRMPVAVTISSSPLRRPLRDIWAS